MFYGTSSGFNTKISKFTKRTIKQVHTHHHHPLLPVDILAAGHPWISTDPVGDSCPLHTSLLHYLPAPSRSVSHAQQTSPPLASSVTDHPGVIKNLAVVKQKTEEERKMINWVLFHSSPLHHLHQWHLEHNFPSQSSPEHRSCGTVSNLWETLAIFIIT